MSVCDKCQGDIGGCTCAEWAIIQQLQAENKRLKNVIQKVLDREPTPLADWVWALLEQALKGGD